jgi:hypothetical protein
MGSRGQGDGLPSKCVCFLLLRCGARIVRSFLGSTTQIIGFGCMVFGSATYYAVLKFKCLTYPAPQPKLPSAMDYVEIQSSSG